MPVANDYVGDVSGSHKPIPDLCFEATGHSGVKIDSNGKMARNAGGAYWACIRLTPAVPATGKWRALFEIARPDSRQAAADSDVPSEGCGSFIGVCDPTRHIAAKSRGMGSAHAWMVSLRTGTRFHNGKDLPAPYASPAPTGSIIAVMIDMDTKVTRIQVDGDIPVRSIVRMCKLLLAASSNIRLTGCCSIDWHIGILETTHRERNSRVSPTFPAARSALQLTFAAATQSRFCLGMIAPDEHGRIRLVMAASPPVCTRDSTACVSGRIQPAAAVRVRP